MNNNEDNNKFSQVLKEQGNFKKTENGMDALSTTSSSLLDFFGQMGALRKRSKKETERIFEKSYKENPLYTRKALSFLRDIRGGLGEREVFRTCLKKMIYLDPEASKEYLFRIMEYGRGDDFYTYVGTPLEFFMFKYINVLFSVDIKNMKKKGSVSLLGKWLKSVNSSSKESRKLGKKTASAFGMKQCEYRKSLAALRKYIDVCEVKMSASKWGSIDYPKVPSYAMKNYKNAFLSHDSKRFSRFLKNVEEGKEKINSATLFPYDLVRFDRIPDKTTELQWKSLPNYIDEDISAIVMADTSGSMSGLPLQVSVSLAIYFSEKNKGPWSEMFMTFSEEPSFITVPKGLSLKEKIYKVKDSPWGFNTNIEAAFKSILDIAIENNIKEEEMPKALIVISDMEFDICQSRRVKKSTFSDKMKELYSENGYTLPHIIYWNVDARNSTFHSKGSDENVSLVSGCSPSIFKSVMGIIGKTPYQSMMEILNNPRYKHVK